MTRLLLAVIVAAIGVALLGFGPPRPEPGPRKPQTYGLLWVKRADTNYRHTRRCELAHGLPVTRNARRYARPHSVGFRRRASRIWRERHRRCLTTVYHPIAAIYYVFGSRAGEAVEVARCETGGTFSIWAKNGQYLGLFQMGSWERSTYGHGSTALAQVRAAYDYFVDSGRDWSPWECKP